MLGLEGTGVALAYIFTILATLLCIVYGWVNWNKGDEHETKEIKEELKWEEKDSKLAK